MVGENDRKPLLIYPIDEENFRDDRYQSKKTKGWHRAFKRSFQPFFFCLEGGTNASKRRRNLSSF